jgi:hypothetical protein
MKLRGRVKIERCSSVGAWYEKLVGKTIEIEFADSMGFWAREGGTYNCINCIPPGDATFVASAN